MMTSEQLQKHWMESAEEDLDVMETLYKNKKYPQSLFYGHLVIEKLLKALFAKVNAESPIAPRIHNLEKLAALSKIELDQATFSSLSLITNFNMAARYDSNKRDFKELCTPKFTMEQIKEIRGLREWIYQKLITK